VPRRGQPISTDLRGTKCVRGDTREEPRAALVDPLTIGLALTSLIALVQFRINSAWLMGVGAVTGWLLT
jgi:hypothetical protein